jgi:hypothetical protein
VVVDEACQIIVACAVTAASNDKEQAVPMAQAALAELARAGIERPTDRSGRAVAVPNLADRGYYSEKAAQGLAALGLDPYLATERQRHQASPAPTAAAASPTAKEAMAAKRRTPVGRALYALRKGIVEPVFGQIKGARGFRRFLLRGLAKIGGEWRLVGVTHNLLKVWRYGCASMGN